MISSMIKQLYSQTRTTGTPVLYLLISSIVLATLFVSLTLAIRLQPVAAAAPLLVKTSSAVVKPSVEVSHPATPEPTATAAPQAAAPQNCIPTDTYAKPTAINMLTASEGLSQVIDTPAYYQIFGNTSGQIQTQLQKCAPRSTNGEAFAGEASYALSWQYTSNNTSGGLCIPANIRVGLHVNMILPKWSPTDQATTDLAGKWQSFINNLTLHENGHVIRDVQYANQLLRNLQNHPATDCAALTAQIQAEANATLADLDAANADYDSHTNHGATQGAILP